MKLNADKTLANLDIKGEMDAAGLDSLLRKLSLLRADMTPEVPGSRGDLNDEAGVLIEDKPALVIAARRDGGFRLWLRHRGFGWLAYQIDNRNAVSMANYINSRGAPEAVNLIQDEDTKRH